MTELYSGRATVENGDDKETDWEEILSLWDRDWESETSLDESVRLRACVLKE